MSKQHVDVTSRAFAIPIAVGGVIFVVALAGAAPTVAVDDDHRIEQLEGAIQQARAAADYDDAIPLARDLLAALRNRDGVAGWQIDDARRLVATVEYAAGLDDDAMKELAEADALDPVQREQTQSSQSAEACETAARQLDIRERLLGEEHQETARTLFRRAECLTYLGKLQDALPLARRSLELRRKLLGPRHPEVADSLFRVASTTWTMGRLEKSEAAAREALALQRELYEEPHADIATTLNRLGQILDVAGRDDEAMTVFDYALEMRMELYGEDHYDVAETLSSMARIYRDRGDLYATEQAYRRSHSIVVRVLDPDDLRYAWSFGGLASALWDQGALAEAEEFAGQALEILRRTRGDEDFHVSRALHVVAQLANEQGRHEDAVKIEREALRIAEKLLGPDHVQIARHLENLGDALRGLGEPDAAWEVHSRALKIMQAGELAPEQVTQSMIPLARDALARGDFAEAEARARGVVERYVAQYGEAHYRSADAHELYGRVLEAGGNREGAIAEMERAARAFDAARLMVGPGVRRATFLRSPYDFLATLYLEDGRSSQAWRALEKARARVLAEVLIAAGHRRLSDEERKRSETLRTDLVDLESQMRAVEARTGDDKQRTRELETIRGRLIQAERAWSAFQAEMTARYPVTGGESLDLARVQAAMEPRDAVVGWLDAGLRSGDRAVSWGYVIRKRGPVRWTRLEPERSSRKAMLVWLDQAAAALSAPPPSALDEPPGRYSQSVRDLWRRRLRPLEAHLEGVKRLIVVPSSPMLGLPVETLVDDGGRFLAERFEFAYAPSSAVLAWLVERPRQTTPREGLLVGDPPFTVDQARAMEAGAPQGDIPSIASVAPTVLRSVLARDAGALGSLPRLFWSRREVATIAGLSSGMRSLVGRSASEQNLTGMARRGELTRFGLLHFATHAVIDRKRPSRSAIVLSQLGLTDPYRPDASGRAYDGLLTGYEIAREWKLEAELVTLSACETALGRTIPGEGTVGLAHTFFQAGARSLLLSLWKVDDQATSLLMERFYANWLGPDRENGHDEKNRTAPVAMSKSRALAEAKRWLREYRDDSGRTPYRHPYYWSAFVLMGDPD